MGFAEEWLSKPRPDSIRAVGLPRRMAFHGSPDDWRDEVIYFLLPDRFSDGQEATRQLLDTGNPAASRPAGFRFDNWSQSGGGRYQGGTIKGLTSQLGYIQALGATTLWVGPVFKQRAKRNDFHGYAVQDFLEVDPRLGTRQDLVDLVSAAHAKNMRVLLDIVVNHTGNNWIYDNGQDRPPFLTWPQFYKKGRWRDRQDNLTTTIDTNDDGVWPTELWDDSNYTRAGEGSLARGDIDDPHAEFRRTDFVGDRDINYDQAGVLDNLGRCYKYWIALTDCDGLRLDALKHMDQESGRNFCGTIKEFAAALGKANFFLLAEIAGSDRDADRYLEVLGTNLDATLDIGEIRPTLTAVAKGLAPPSAYFNLEKVWDDDLGSHRNSGKRRVSVLDDHDHVSGEKVRFSSDAASDHQVVAGVALQLFGLGIPCVNYGTEQAFAGPEKNLRDQFLPDYGVGDPPPDKYLREAMFGPEHPRLDGIGGLNSGAAVLDSSMFGFGPFGTSGAHCFNRRSAAFIRISALIEVRRNFPPLRYGRQYQREISNFGAPFALSNAGELIAWSRILDDEEILCVVNGHGTDFRGGDVLIDPALNDGNAAGDPWSGAPPFLLVIANTAQTAAGAGYAGSHPIGSKLAVQSRGGVTYVPIRDLGPSEVLALTNRP
jgi:glycosidase